MSNNALKAVAGSETAKPKGTDLAHILTAPGTLAQIKAALPKHMTAERMARVALTEVRKIPKLAKCEARTFIGAIIQLSQLGLEPGGILGHAYLIPFENKKQGTVEIQIIIGYRGMIDLARRSGQISSIQAVIVRDGDAFQVSLGLNPDLKHEPSYDPERPMTHVYAVAVFKDGARQFDVMSRAEVEKIRNSSQGYKSAVQYNKTDNPWMTHFEEMAKKTIIRRLFKYLPVSIEMQRAVAIDERGDAGLSQIIDDTGAIDGSSTEVDENAPQLSDGTGNDNSDGKEYTYADVASAIAKADTPEAIDAAKAMITGVTDERQRAELDVEQQKKRKAIGAKLDQDVPQ